jgi:hypothetical protein
MFHHVRRLYLIPVALLLALVPPIAEGVVSPEPVLTGPGDQSKEVRSTK